MSTWGTCLPLPSFGLAESATPSAIIAWSIGHWSPSAWLPSPICRWRSPLVKPDLAVLSFNATSLFLVWRRCSVRTIGHEGVSHAGRWFILDVEAYLSLFMHKESFTSNMSSSIVRSVRSTLMFRGPGLFNSFAILLYRLNIILCWCHPFIIRVQYYGFLFGQLEFPLPVYSSRAQDLVSPCM